MAKIKDDKHSNGLMSVNEAIQFLKKIEAFQSPVDSNRLDLITTGKTESQAKAIRNAAQMSTSDIQVVEGIMVQLQNLGFDVKVKGSARNNSISIIGNLDKKQEFKMDIGVSNNGEIVINGMPSVDGLIAKVYGEGDKVGLTTMSSEYLWNFSKKLSLESTKRKIEESKSRKNNKQIGSYLNWLSKKAKEDTLALSSSEAQTSVFKDIGETLKKAGTNAYRTQWQKGLVYLNGLYKDLVKTAGAGARRGPLTTRSQRERSDAALKNQLEIMGQLYLSVGPQEAEKIILRNSDFSNIVHSGLWGKFKNIFNQIGEMGAYQGTLSENGAAQTMMALNNIARPGQIFVPKSSRKVVQTNLTAQLRAKENSQRNKSIFASSNALKNNLHEQDGNFDLFRRAFVNNKNIRQGYAALKMRHGYGNMSAAEKKQFEKLYGQGFESVDVDALLYLKSMEKQYNRIDTKSEKISQKRIAEKLKKEYGISVEKIDEINNVYDWTPLLKEGHTQKGKGGKVYNTRNIITNIAASLSQKAKKDRGLYGGQNVKNFSIDDSFDDSSNLLLSYNLKQRFSQGKFVSPSGTYREVGAPVNDELAYYILKAAGYDDKTLGVTGADFNAGSLIKGKKMNVQFLANATTGMDVMYNKQGRQVNSVAKKGVYDLFTGYLNTIADEYRQFNGGKGDYLNKFLEGMSSHISRNTNISEKDREEIGKLFKVHGDKISWSDDLDKNRILRNNTLEVLYSLGQFRSDKNLWGNNAANNPFNIIREGEEKYLDIVEPLVLTHEMALHNPKSWGAASRKTSGYELVQGYREKDATKRMLHEISNSDNVKQVDNALAYVDAMFEQTQISKEKYTAINRRLDQVKKEAWSVNTTEQSIKKKYDALKDKEQEAIIIDPSIFTQRDLRDNNLEYDNSGTGLVTKGSFKNSYLYVLENEIERQRKEKGIKGNAGGIPNLYFKMPGGGLYHLNLGAGHGVGDLMPILYRQAEFKKSKGGYELSPEAGNILNVIKTIVDATNSDNIYNASGVIGQEYFDYLKALDEDITKKGHSTYDRANKADIYHAVSPQTVGSHGFDVADKALRKHLEGAITASREDVEMMLRPSSKDLETYGKDYEGFRRDILEPMYKDVFGEEFKMSRAEEAEYSAIKEKGALLYNEKGKVRVDKNGNPIRKNADANKNSKDAARYVEGLIRERLLDSITIGTKAFEATGGKGLLAAVNRYPSSNGRDIRMAKLLIDSRLTAGHMGGDQALMDIMNADYDGDHGVVHLWYADGSVVTKKLNDPKLTKLFGADVMKVGRDAFEIQKQNDAMYRKIQARAESEAKGNQEGLVSDSIKGNMFLSQKEIDGLSDETKDFRALFLSKYNKGVTGTGSNLYQAITQAMVNKGIDETSEGVGQGAGGLAASIVRSFEESFVQNAISSKKVQQQDGTANVKWWNEVYRVFDALNKGSLYTKHGEGINKSFSDVYDKMQSLDILTADDTVTGAFTARIAAPILAMASRAEGEEAKKIAALFGKQAKIKNGKISNASELRFNKEVIWNAMQYVNHLAGNDKFLENAVNDRYSLVPGTGQSFINILNNKNPLADADKLAAAGFELRDGKITSIFDIEVSQRTKQAFDLLERGAIGLADFANYGKSATVQWAEFIDLAERSNNNQYVGYSSPTGIIENFFGRKDFGFDNREEISLFDRAYQKHVKGEKGPINMYENGGDRYYGFTKESFEKGRALKESQLKGTYIHGMAQLYGDVFKDLNSMTEEERNNFSFKGKTWEKVIENFGNLSQEQFFDLISGKNFPTARRAEYKKRYDENLQAKKEIENFLFSTALPSEIENGKLKTTSRGGMLLNNLDLVAATQAKGVRSLLGEEGKIIGSEMPALGVNGGKLFSGRSDMVYISYEKNDKGELIPYLNILDYKNTSSGKATPKNFAQAMLYGKAYNLLGQDIRTSGLTSSEAYLNEGTSSIAKKYRQFFDEIEDENEKARKLEEFGGLFDALSQGDIRTRLHISSVGNNGKYTQYMMDFDKPEVKAALAAMDAAGGMPVSDAVREQVVQAIYSRAVEEGSTYIPGYLRDPNANTSEYNEAIKKASEYYSVQEKIWEIEQKINDLNKKGLVNEATSLELQKDKLDEDLKKRKEDFANIEETLEPDDIKKLKEFEKDIEKGLGVKHEAYLERVREREATGGIKQYEQLLRQRTQLRTSIYGDELKAQTVVGDRFARTYQDRVMLNRDQLQEVENAIKDLTEQMRSNTKFQERREKVEEKYAYQEQRGRATANIANRGQSTLWGTIGSHFTNSLYRFLNYGAALKIIQGAGQTLRKVIGYAEQLDNALTNIRIVTGKTTEEVSNMMKGYSNLATELSTSTIEIANSAAEWLRQGYDVAEVNDLVTSTMYLSRLGMISATEATKNLTSAMKGFKLEASDSMEIVDKLTTLDMNAATTAGEIANALSHFANTASLSGVNIDQASAMATTIMDVSQMSGGTAGNALKTIMSRYGNVKAGVFSGMSDEESGDTSDNLNDVEKVLRKVGISIRDTKNEFRDFDEVLDDLGEIWSSLDSVSKNAIATAFAGVRQREAFVTLLENMDKYNSLVEISANSTGTAAKKYQSYQEQLEAAKKRVQAAWEGLANNKELQSSLIQIQKILEGIIKSLPNVIRYGSRFLAIMNAHKIPGALSGIGGYLMPSGLRGFFNSGQTAGQKAGGIFKTLFAPWDYKNMGGREELGLNVMRRMQEASVANTNALNRNTDALNGEKTGKSVVKGGVQTFGQGFNLREYSKNEIANLKPYNRAISNTGAKMTQQDIDSQIIGNIMIGEDGKPRYARTYTDLNGVTHKAGSVVRGKNNLKLYNQAMSNQEAYRALKAQKQRGVTQSAAAGVMGALTGYMTASTTMSRNGVEYEMSEKTASFSKGSTAAVQGVLSAINPILGQIAGMGMDMLWKNVFGPWMEAEKIARKERVAQANETLKVLNGTQSHIETLNNLAEKGINTASNQGEWEEAIGELLKSISGSEEADENARRNLNKYLKDNLAEMGVTVDQNADIYTLINTMEGNQETQLQLTQALLIAQKEAAYNELVASKEEEISNIYTQAREAQQKYNDKIKEKAEKVEGATVRGTTLIGAGTGLAIGAAGGPIGAAAGALAGAVMGLLVGVGLGNGFKNGILEGSLDTNFNFSDRIQELEEKISAEYAKGDKADQTTISMLNDILERTIACKTSLEAIYKEEDISRMEIAAAKAGVTTTDALGNEVKEYLTDMTQYKLTNILGLDEVKKIIVEQYEALGGSTNKYSYAEDGSYTDWLDSVFNQAINAEGMEFFKKLFSGKGSTLAEALALPAGEFTDQILSNFVNAIGVKTVEELEKLKDQFGDISLSDWLLSDKEIADKLSKITSAMNDWTSDSKTLSEKQRDIISNFPDLVKYLGDTKSLMGELVKYTENYATIEINSRFKDIMTNEEVWKELRESMLSDEEIGETVKDLLTNNTAFSNIENLYGLKDWLAANSNEAIEEYIQEYYKNTKLYADEQRTYINSVMDYRIKLMDQELENLNSQKETLASINEERKYENDLVEARLKLENASKEKKRIYRAGVGWVYESDQAAIKEAQDALDELTNQKLISQLEEQAKILEGQKEELEAIKKADEETYQKQLYETFVEKWGQGTFEDFSRDSLSALKGLSEIMSNLWTTSLGNTVAQRQSAISDLNTQYENGLGELLVKVQQGNASSEEISQYREKARAYQESYNNYVNNGLLSSQDFNNGVLKGSYDLAVNNEGQLGAAYINNDRDKSYYYVVKGASGKDSIIIKRPDNFVNSLGEATEKAALGKNTMKINLATGELLQNTWETLDDIPEGIFVVPGAGGGVAFIKDAEGRYYLLDENSLTSTVSTELLEKSGITTGLHTGDELSSALGNSYANGSVSIEEGLSRINELGTEAIITPQGTITSLPSNTGIIPADITKNLWQLGEVAPTLVRELSGNIIPDTIGKSVFGTITDESFNIDRLEMNVNADASFDVDKFVKSIKSRVALTRNSK